MPATAAASAAATVARSQAVAEQPAVGLKSALALAAAGTLLLGIFPSVVLDFARRASAMVK
jgi:hypothetical protein